MKEILIKVEGMVCSGCENRIQNALKTVDGVISVVANYGDGTVKVILNSEIEENILKEKIEDLGFDVKED